MFCSTRLSSGSANASPTPAAYSPDAADGRDHGGPEARLTVDVYGHLVPGANRAAMEQLPTVEDPPEEAAKTDALVFG